MGYAAWRHHPMETFPRHWPFVREITGHRWIILTKASDAELWWVFLSVPEQTTEQTIETLVIWDAIAVIMTSLQCTHCRNASFVVTYLIYRTNYCMSSTDHVTPPHRGIAFRNGFLRFSPSCSFNSLRHNGAKWRHDRCQVIIWTTADML